MPAPNPILDQLSRALSGLSTSTQGKTLGFSQQAQLSSILGGASSLLASQAPKPQTPSAGASTLSSTKPAASVKPAAPSYATPAPSFSSVKPSAPSVSSPKPSASETPAQTYQRVTGQSWTGGNSAPVTALLQQAGINAAPGSAEANLALQRYLNSGAKPAQPPAAVSPAAIQAPAPQPEQPQAQAPAAVTYESLVQNLLNEAGNPFDYGAAAKAGKAAYEGAFGSVDTQTEKQRADATALFEREREKALQEIRGNLATRGLSQGGVADKELLEGRQKFTENLSSTLNKITTDAQQNQNKSVLDFVTDAAKARESARSNLLSFIPSLMKSTQPSYSGGVVGEYQFYAEQERAAGRQPMGFNEYATMDANRKAKATGGAGGGGSLLTPYQQFTATQDLRKQLQRNTDGAREVQRQFSIMEAAFGRLQNGQAKDLNATSQAIITEFNKIMDPSSVVRESEYARSLQGQALLTSLAGKANALIQGGPGLTVESLKEFVEAARVFSANAVKSLEAQNRLAEENAKAFGLNPSLITGGAPTGGDPVAELEDDIRQLGGNYSTREQLIEALTSAYPELTRDQIASKVYTLIPDKAKKGPFVESL